MLKVLKEEMSYEKYIEMQKNWLKNLKLEWLIMGHLEEEEALKIVDSVEGSLKYNKIEKEDLHTTRLAKIPEMSIHEYNELNTDPANPNSAIAIIL